MKIDYQKIGLKIGLECHQQLETKEKLFCACKPELFTGEPTITFIRRLRPTQSELGQIDSAAYFEFQKGAKIIYEANWKNACLVEMDEEPPHKLNNEALSIALTIAFMMNAEIVDELHIMRKVVIDGSNTSGFQRTCIIALNGLIEVEGKKIKIQHIGLEEDAARKTGVMDFTISYRIDRLCIPLLEIATAPDIYTPEDAEKVALTIGKIMRATGRTKRGIGSIRQDLNISIRDGALIEIKGVQELVLISKIVRYEVERQLKLLDIRKQLQNRRLIKENIKEEIINVTSIFKEFKFGPIQKAINEGKQVLAVKLPKFAGLLGTELVSGLTLALEIADRASFWSKVSGIIHTDDLPSWISHELITKLRKFMHSGSEDAIVLVIDDYTKCITALKAVIQRSKDIFEGIPEETRAPKQDGTTRFSRPRPGAARMYPETDVPPIEIFSDYLENIRYNIPELPEQKINRLIKEYNINKKLANQLQDSKYGELFERIVVKTKMSPTFIAATLTETLKALQREGVNLERVSDNKIVKVFNLVGSEQTSKEAIPEIIKWLSKNDAKPGDAIKTLNLIMLSNKELNNILDDFIKENTSLIEEKGIKAFGILMGMIMKKYRGKVNVEFLNKILKEKLLKNT
jgi:glutamyl-tRNA(Gln) amidotransferase subunit E